MRIYTTQSELEFWIGYIEAEIRELNFRSACYVAECEEPNKA